ncbi:TonB-dependent receptor [Porphyromonas crevioricanis]|uniref:TonB-dependent receptor n=1 Tax=Porphyromonas crevioricanis TaxID=393921 RepID=UPI001363AAE0|nr:TonB-dependent receptor [Porphyromonas crevioricanis]
MKRKLSFGIFCLCCIAFYSLSAQQTTNYRVSGIVVDSLRAAPIPYATVEMQSVADSNSRIGGVSDAEGRFSLEGVANKEYILIIRCVGYQTSRHHCTLQNRDINLGKVYLTEDSRLLGETTVVARKKLIKLLPEGLSYDMQNDRVAQSLNLLEALRYVPMIDVDGNGQIRVKGSGNFSLYINGKPYRIAELSLKEILQTIPASNIKKIEVITQPDSRYDAETGTVVVNIVTNKNRLDGYHGTISLGSNTKEDINATGSILMSKKKLDLSLAYSYQLDRQQDQPYSLLREIYRDGQTVSRFTSEHESGNGNFRYHTLRTMLSYDADSLNTIYADGHALIQNPDFRDAIRKSVWQEGQPIHYIKTQSQSNYTSGSIEGNLIYHNLYPVSKKERFVLGYRYSYNPTYNNANITERNYKDGFVDWETSPYTEIRHRRSTEGGLSEHTLQSDYVIPWRNSHTLRVGAKGVIRFTSVSPHYTIWNSNTQTWEEGSVFPTGPYEDMKQKQYIAEGYLGYNFWRKSNLLCGRIFHSNLARVG